MHSEAGSTVVTTSPTVSPTHTARPEASHTSTPTAPEETSAPSATPSSDAPASGGSSTSSDAASVPREYTSALKSAESYLDIFPMSKAALYDQLVSEYGGQFSAEAAQYAVDNVKADWKKNALESAKDYQELMNMSPNAIYDQLVSDYGGQFTEEEAQYAVDNLPA